MPPVNLPTYSRLLIELGLKVRAALSSSQADAVGSFAAVSRVEASDIVYAVDAIAEETIEAWFDEHWQDLPPVQLIMEGNEAAAPCIFPRQASKQKPHWLCLIDPVDGTRGIMFDKRPAWFIAALIPNVGPVQPPTLDDCAVSVLVELPTSKAGLADHFAATRGCGPAGLIAERMRLHDGLRCPITPSPCQQSDLAHGFASVAKFFPEIKAQLAAFETDLFDRLGYLRHSGSPIIFDDQYMSTGGQFYEVLMGHDRLVIDVRREAYRSLGYHNVLCCHPYDIGAWMILAEAGCVIESPDGSPLAVPVDTETPVSWVAYGNKQMADIVRPVLQACLSWHFPPRTAATP